MVYLGVTFEYVGVYAFGVWRYIPINWGGVLMYLRLLLIAMFTVPNYGVIRGLCQNGGVLQTQGYYRFWIIRSLQESVGFLLQSWRFYTSKGCYWYLR